jgi:hypothetical protein
MSSAGHVQDMISRMKANEAMKNSRRKTYQKIREKLRYAYEDERRFTYIDKKIPKEELERIKSAIRADLKKERMKVFILTSVVTFLILASFFAFIMLKMFQ